MHAQLTATSASVGSIRRASGTLSTRTSPAPYRTVARIPIYLALPADADCDSWRGEQARRRGNRTRRERAGQVTDGARLFAQRPRSARFCVFPLSPHHARARRGDEERLRDRGPGVRRRHPAPPRPNKRTGPGRGPSAPDCVRADAVEASGGSTTARIGCTAPDRKRDPRARASRFGRLRAAPIAANKGARTPQAWDRPLTAEGSHASLCVDNCVGGDQNGHKPGAG